MRLAAHLTHLDDPGLSRRWAELLAPLVGKTSAELLHDSVQAHPEVEALRAENEALRARIATLLRTVEDLARR